ncbi:MAG: ABC transporter ATP-binding protein [Pseudomonadota bacterium]
MMLCVHGLFFSYKKTEILSDIRLELRKGEVLGIVGPNGAGKTTLLRCIAGIARPEKGSIRIDGRDIFGMKKQNLAKRIGYVPQTAPYKFPVTVFETVLMGRRPYISWRPSENDLKVVADLLRSMDLADIAMRYFDQLSGGQKQKVLLAKAFAQETDLLLLDEPTSNLDLRHQMEVMEMISSMAREKGIAAILAMHDLNLTSRFANTILMLNNGKTFCIGEPYQVMTRENIASVYGVETEINASNGYPYILPIRPVGQ